MTRPDLALRRLGPDDWETYRAIRLEMLRDAPDAFWSTLEDALAHDEAVWRQRLAGGVTLVAESGGRPVGSVGVMAGFPPDAGPETTCLIAMYVAPAARGTGVGRLLVEAALGAAVEEGRRVVHLDVASNNVAALALYTRLGFAPTGERTPHPRRDDLEEIAMERAVP